MEENFLKRWSRLKRAPAALPTEPAKVAKVDPVAAAAAGPTTPSAPLPAVDGLELSSDFLPFMQGEVAEGVRRAALQKLFSAEHFNVMDGLDVYIDDYNKFEPIGEEMLRQLMQARALLQDDVAEPAASAAPEADAGDDDAAHDPANSAANGTANRAKDKPA
jgi:hypothetical protein